MKYENPDKKIINSGKEGKEGKYLPKFTENVNDERNQ